MLAGAGLLAFGTALTLVAIASGDVALFYVGAVIAGAGFGAGFQGAIRTVIALAAPHERAGVLSVLYVVAYLAMGVPAVLGGMRAAATGDLRGTALEYGAVVIALALAALVATFVRARRAVTAS